MPSELLTREQVEKLKDATPVVVAHICDTLLATMDERDKWIEEHQEVSRIGFLTRVENAALREERDALRRAVEEAPHWNNCALLNCRDECDCWKSKIGGAK